MTSAGIYASSEKAAAYASLEDARSGMLKRGESIAHPGQGRMNVGIFVGLSLNGHPWIHYSLNPSNLPSVKSYGFKEMCDRFDRENVRQVRKSIRFHDLKSVNDGSARRGELVRVDYAAGIFVGYVCVSARVGNGAWICCNKVTIDFEYRDLCRKFDSMFPETVNGLQVSSILG